MGYDGYSDEAHETVTPAKADEAAPVHEPGAPATTECGQPEQDAANAAAPGIKSAGLGVTTIGACFATGERELNLNPDGWAVMADGLAGRRQAWLIQNLPGFRACAANLPVRCRFSDSADVINAFLEEEGFKIRLDALGPDEYGMAAVMKLAMTWAFKGMRTRLTANDGIPYEAAHLPGPEFAAIVPDHPHPIAMVETEDGKTVLLTEIGGLASADDVELLVGARALYAARTGGERSLKSIGGVTFPVTELDVEPDISWLKGLRTTNRFGRGCKVTQAVQQIKLVLDENGAKVEEATAMSMTFEALCTHEPAEPLMIRGPFLAAIIAPVDGVPTVINAFRCAPDAWTKAAAAGNEDGHGTGGHDPDEPYFLE